MFDKITFSSYNSKNNLWLNISFVLFIYLFLHLFILLIFTISFPNVSQILLVPFVIYEDQFVLMYDQF